MKIVLVHNSYQQPGGEDIVFGQERDLLRSRGHEVVEYVRSNHEVKQFVSLRQLALAKRTIWAGDTRREFRQLLLRERPNVVHVHNTFVMISPSIYWACRAAQVPVVQTLHNYRLFCPSGNFLREGRICEECLQRSLWRGVSHGCYHGSRLATATVAMMLTVHRWRETWTQLVDCYIVLSEFARRKFQEAGLSASKLVVKPNFVAPDPGVRTGEGEYALFVGRLSEEKGLTALLAAWDLAHCPVPLRIIGDGPLRPELEMQVAQRKLTGITFCGRLTHPQTLAAIKGAKFLIYPSGCYEQCPTAILEAYACGVPVMAPALGSMEEMVADGCTGVHFRAGDPDDLAAKIQGLCWDAQRLERMGHGARAEYEARYTPERNYQKLVKIYQGLISSRLHLPGPRLIPGRDEQFSAELT
jgi:glycosyltransferase involved in cell wall biosynthesis